MESKDVAWLSGASRADDPGLRGRTLRASRSRDQPCPDQPARGCGRHAAFAGQRPAATRPRPPGRWSDAARRTLLAGYAACSTRGHARRARAATRRRAGNIAADSARCAAGGCAADSAGCAAGGCAADSARCAVRGCAADSAGCAVRGCAAGHARCLARCHPAARCSLAPRRASAQSRHGAGLRRRSCVHCRLRCDLPGRRVRRIQRVLVHEWNPDLHRLPGAAHHHQPRSVSRKCLGHAVPDIWLGLHRVHERCSQRGLHVHWPRHRQPQVAVPVA
jgi:hypothetical protein